MIVITQRLTTKIFITGNSIEATILAAHFTYTECENFFVLTSELGTQNEANTRLQHKNRFLNFNNTKMMTI